MEFQKLNHVSRLKVSNKHNLFKIKNIVDGASTVEPLNPTVANNLPLPRNNVKNDVEQITNNQWTRQVFNKTSGRYTTFYDADYG